MKRPRAGRLSRDARPAVLLANQKGQVRRGTPDGFGCFPNPGCWNGGWKNIVIALALGTILSAFYLWRRDLVANMIGHFAVDFVGVILPRLVHHS